MLLVAFFLIRYQLRKKINETAAYYPSDQSSLHQAILRTLEWDKKVVVSFFGVQKYVRRLLRAMIRDCAYQLASRYCLAGEFQLPTDIIIRRTIKELQDRQYFFLREHLEGDLK